MQKLLPWILVLLATVAAGAALQLRHQDRLDLESRIASLEADREGQRGEIERLRDEIAEAKASESAAPGADFLAALFGGNDAGSAGTDEPSRDPDGESDGAAEAAAGLLGGEFFEQIQVQMARQRVRELDRDVELTDREREEIEALFTRQAEEIAGMSASMLAGEPLDLESFGRDYTDESAELRRILGDQRFEQYEVAQAHRFEEQQELGFQTQYRFFASEVGLSADQHDAVEPLMRAYDLSPAAGMAAADFQPGVEARSMRELMEQSIDRRREQSADLRTDLAEFLDDEQLHRFDGWIEQQEAQSEMMMSFMPDVMMPGFE